MPLTSHLVLEEFVHPIELKPALIYDAATNLNPVRADGPLLSDYIAGSFIDDFEYVFQEGDLDQYNGRFCKTPEFPEGVYAYFVSIDASRCR